MVVGRRAFPIGKGNFSGDILNYRGASIGILYRNKIQSGPPGPMMQPCRKAAKVSPVVEPACDPKNVTKSRHPDGDKPSSWVGGESQA